MDSVVIQVWYHPCGCDDHSCSRWCSGLHSVHGLDCESRYLDCAHEWVLFRRTRQRSLQRLDKQWIRSSLMECQKRWCGATMSCLNNEVFVRKGFDC